MMDYKEIKRKEVLFEIIDDVTNGMDIYNHNGSLWIINTKELKWVVEFTNDKTLWYNYNLFKNLFKAISLDVSENQKYITEWFESKFLNVYTVKTTVDPFFDQDQYVKETIQNGVKDTKEFKWLQIDDVEDTIQNGVKRTVPESIADSFAIADTIQNGVKHTDCYDGRRSKKVDDTIQNGVKQTELSKRDFFPEDILQNGIMETIGTLRRTVEWGVDDIIQNGVKHTEDGDWLDGDERFIKSSIMVKTNP
jgi:DNA repair exonuclease SbcCD nuclease subunit